MASEITCEGWKKELNLVSWNGGPAKLDIREWSQDHTTMKRGITMNRREFTILVDALSGINAEMVGEGSSVRMESRDVTAKTETRNEDEDKPDS